MAIEGFAMTKKELIELLQSTDLPDDAPVLICTSDGAALEFDTTLVARGCLHLLIATPE